tara:strand:- start:1905 stop:2219 length:315 start_codon:yes stop_codon:yes gene_type:complete
MRTRDKQNKHKLKFMYISNLKKLGKIWKKHCKLLDPSITKTHSTYNHEVIRLMDESTKKEYCLLLDKCDDIIANFKKVDVSLKTSHSNFSENRKIILDHLNISK